MGSIPDEIGQALLAELWKIQEARGLSNGEVAAMIGIDRTYLGRIKSRVRGQRLSLELALRIVAAFPELGAIVSPIVPIIADAEPQGETQRQQTTES